MQPARCMPEPASNLHLKYKGRLALNSRYNDRFFAHGLFCCCSPYQWQAGPAQLMDAAVENHRLEPREDGAARLVQVPFSGSEWLFWNLGSRSTFSFIKAQVIASRYSGYSDDPGKTTHNWIFLLQHMLQKLLHRRPRSELHGERARRPRADAHAKSLFVAAAALRKPCHEANHCTHRHHRETHSARYRK